MPKDCFRIRKQASPRHFHNAKTRNIKGYCGGVIQPQYPCKTDCFLVWRQQKVYTCTGSTRYKNFSSPAGRSTQALTAVV